MNSYVQLFCLVGSFCYGMFMYYCNKIHFYFIHNKMILVRFIGNLLYVFNMSLFYVCVLYKVNNGILHLYFILFLLVGYFFVSVKKRKS